MGPPKHIENDRSQIYFSTEMDLEHLPCDILYDICVRLPIRSLLWLRCTSKVWYARLVHPKFVDWHLNCAIENPGYILASHTTVSHEKNIYFAEDVELGIEEPKLLGKKMVDFASSGGLIAYHRHDTFYICNPMIGEQIELPVDPISRHRNGMVFWGFGYSMSTKEYKIVKFCPLYPRKRIDLVSIYTLGSGSWRQVPFVTSSLSISSLMSFSSLGSQVACRGTLFWLMVNPSYRSGVENILSFDLESEKFQVLSGPPTENGNKNLVGQSHRLVNIPDTIAYVVRDGFNIRIWVLRDKENAVWINGYSFDSHFLVHCDVKSIGIWMKRFLLNASNSIRHLKGLRFPKINLFNKAEKQFLETIEYAVPHAGSLVSPFNIMPKAGRVKVCSGRLAPLA